MDAQRHRHHDGAHETVGHVRHWFRQLQASQPAIAALLEQAMQQRQQDCSTSARRRTDQALAQSLGERVLLGGSSPARAEVDPGRAKPRTASGRDARRASRELPRHRTVPLDERAEVPWRQTVAVKVAVGDDRRRARRLCHQRDLAEVIAGSELSYLAACLRHRCGAVVDHKEFCSLCLPR